MPLFFWIKMSTLPFSRSYISFDGKSFILDNAVIINYALRKNCYNEIRDVIL